MSAKNKNSDLGKTLEIVLDIFNEKEKLVNVIQANKKIENDDITSKILQLQDTAIIPETLRGKTQQLVELQKLADHRREPFIILINNILFIDGKMGWKSTYIIEAINKSKDRFSAPLNYKTVGSAGRNDFGKRAFSYDLHGNLIEGPLVTMQIAVDSGWTSKENSMWNQLPELMLSYRAATLFGRLFCPDVFNGFHTADELADIFSLSGTLPTEAIDSKIVNKINQISNNLIKNNTKEEQKNLNKNLKTLEKEEASSTLSKLDDLVFNAEECGFVLSQLTFHQGKFFLKANEVEFENSDFEKLVDLGFHKTTRGAYIFDVTEIANNKEKSDAKR